LSPTLPKRLHPDDTVAIISPASPPRDPGVIDLSVAALEGLGLRPMLAPHARNRLGFIAGTDRERAGDLMRMFSDQKIKAIFCVRGGYGTGRLLSLLDYGVIRRNPKIFIGYSDITALHCALLVKANLLSFHGPMLGPDIAKPDFPVFARNNLMQTLTGAAASAHAHGIRHGCDSANIRILRRGRASGPLIGGNLSILCSLIGTPFQPPFRNKILFLEDVDEPPYRVDRMLTHLLNAGVLQTVAGVAVGVCENCTDPKAKTAREYRQSLDGVLKERLAQLKVPVVTGLPFGHTRYNATIPVGGKATLDATQGDLIMTGPVVK
jgi:muramoyltetrapeptide carboxypeptidase